VTRAFFLKQAALAAADLCVRGGSVEYNSPPSPRTAGLYEH
jgi:hypothetical protein